MAREDDAEATLPQSAAVREAWEERYIAAKHLWSGRPNDALVALAADLALGEAVDLGCGEGADAVWLAERGWRVDAVDVSPTALSRGAEVARDRGVDGRITWIEHDLAQWRPGGSYDLVTASFLHSSIAFPRAAVLRRAAEAVRPGGRMIVIGHAAAPPWMPAEHAHHHEFPSPAEERDELALDPAQWETAECRTRRRTASGPDGTAELDDSILVLRRRAPRPR